MPFFRCVFPAGITADNLETAKRMRLSCLKTPHRMPDSRYQSIELAEVWPLQSYRFRCGAGASG
jgi:hypothetical protein